MSARQCLLVHCEPVDMATGVTVPVRCSAGAGAATYGGARWTDAVLDALPRAERQAYVIEKGLGGRSIPSFGSLVLRNDRFEQDALARLAWDGRPFTVYRGPRDGALEDFTAVLRGTTDQPTFDSGKLTIPTRDAASLFDRPVLTETYAGTGGYEGYSGLAGTKKPALIGFADQVEPTLIDPALLVYQVARSVGGVAAVKERGKAFALVSVGDVFAWAAAPVAGTVAYDYGRGVFALGAPPQGPITASAGLGAYDRHGSAVVFLLQQLLDFSFQPPIDLDALIALDAALPGQMGLYLNPAADGDRTVAAVLDEIATSAGAWWGLTLPGTFTMRQWAWRAPVATLREGRDFRVALKAEPVELPVSRFFFRYARRYRVLTEAELGNVEITAPEASTAAKRLAREDVKRQWRIAQYNTEDTTRRKLARELTVDSLYADDFLAARNAMLVQGRLLARDRWKLAIEVHGRFGQLEYADTVRLETPRFGFNATDWMVVGKSEQLAEQPEDDRTTLRLWGPKGAGE